MQCGLIQDLLDAHRIVDHFNGLGDVLITRDGQVYRVKDWFLDHPKVLKRLKLNGNRLTYASVSKQLNRVMADLF